MKPGDQVICINDTKDSTISYSVFKNWIVEQEKYTIRRVENQGRVLLEEVRNPSVYIEAVMGNVEPGFSKTRFALYEDYILGKTEKNEKSNKYELHSN